MPKKLPAMMWYPGDWRKDPSVQAADFQTRGIWFECLNVMWDTDRRGELSGTSDELCRMIGCTKDELESAVSVIKRLNIADIKHINNTNITTIVCRRMARDEKVRVDAKDRQQKHREKGGGDPHRWTSIRVKILSRDSEICAYCGKKANTVDHVLPKSQGGTEEDSNLVAACKGCNFKKTNKSPEEAGMTFWKHHPIHGSNTKITPPSSVTSSPSGKEKEKYKRENEKRHEKSIEEEFNDSFWSIYRRKQDKKKALDAFKKVRIKLSVPLDTIIIGLESFNEAMDRGLINGNTEFVKLPATWLNGECWNNVYQYKSDESSGPSSDVSEPSPEQQAQLRRQEFENAVLNLGKLQNRAINDIWDQEAKDFEIKMDHEHLTEKWGAEFMAEVEERIKANQESEEVDATP